MSATPGPWHVLPNYASAPSGVMDREGNVIADTFQPNAKDNARLIATAPDLEMQLSLFLRTYWDGSRHGFTDSWRESMDTVAEQARQLLKQIGKGE